MEQVGETFDAVVYQDAVVLRATRHRYKLADLLAQCDKNAPACDLGAWDDLSPVGQEVW